MGVLGLPFDEVYGGMGAGPVEVGIVAQELGRVLAPEPFLTSVVLAGGVVAAAGTDEQKASVLEALASGESVLAFAHAEPGTRWTTSATAVTASGSGADWTLSGVKEPVPHGARADRLVVSAALPDGGTGLFLVDGDAADLTRTGYATFDGGRAARLGFESTPAVPLGSGDATSVIARALDGARIAAANQAIGAMEFALNATSEYLRSRKQFGVPLKTFQALTFRASDMYVSLELATSLAVWATMVLASGTPEEVAEAAARAGLQVSRASRHIGQEAIQLHGGIAMTAEYSVGSYTSHLTALDHLLGDGQFHLSVLAGAIDDHEEVDPLP
jgi:alkylation response protein AidB-like acyl-CoA dehydrogenase